MSRAEAQRRHNPLDRDIETQGGRLRTKSIIGKRKSRSDENGNRHEYIDASSSRKILAISKELADEDAADRARAQPVRAPSAFDFESRFVSEYGEEGAEQANYYDEDEEAWEPDEEVEEVNEEDLDPQELAMFKKFLPEHDTDLNIASLSTKSGASTVPPTAVGEADGSDDEGEPTNLTALILQRIAEKEARDAAKENPHQPRYMGGGAPEDAVEIPAKVADTFTKVGQLLSRYKSGPLPKPFKVLPTLPQWPELLQITQPEKWTPHASYRATKIFISANASTGQHFLNSVLLDKVREEIQETKKLNVHLYNALKATFYRPAAFFKGFLFPLVDSGCTLREAHIVSSVLARIKIPVLHSAAALLRLCEICAEQTSSINSEAAGSANIFIRTLLGKKYALPYKVVDALVFHFLRFRVTKDDSIHDNNDGLASKEAKLPVLWHQSLLIFAQTYRNEITEDQREALLDLLLARGHKDIGPEVRRELLAGRNRGSDDEAKPDENGKDDGDDTMDVS